VRQLHIIIPSDLSETAPYTGWHLAGLGVNVFFDIFFFEIYIRYVVEGYA
jgi:hypothetical protein